MARLLRLHTIYIVTALLRTLVFILALSLLQTEDDEINTFCRVTALPRAIACQHHECNIFPGYSLTIKENNKAGIMH